MCSAVALRPLIGGMASEPNPSTMPLPHAAFLKEGPFLIAWAVPRAQAFLRYVVFLRFQAIEDQSEMPISMAPASPVMTSGM